MSNVRAQSGPTFHDALGTRLSWAVIASLLINLLLWRAAAAVARHPPHFDIRPVEITRVIMDTKGHKVEKVVTKKQIEKKVAQVHKQIQQRKSEPKPLPRKEQAVRPKKPIRVAQKPPEGAHNRVLLAPPDKMSPPKPDDHSALPGGNADLGKPTDQQNSGEAKVNPPEPTKKEVAKPPEPAKPVKIDTSPPSVPVKVAKAEPEPRQQEPIKVESPKPKGPTKDAEPEDQTKPEIPDDLKKSAYKSFVRVKVEIEADGSFTPILRTSSGSPEIDQRVLEALKKWKWKPALKDGVAVKSTQLFKFEFEVE